MPTAISDQQIKKAKSKLQPVPGSLDAHVIIWPILADTPTAPIRHGVSVKIGKAAMKSRLCGDKADILKFLSEVL